MFDCTDSILHSSCAGGTQSFFEQLALERELMVIDHSRLQHLQMPAMKSTLIIKPKARLRSQLRGHEEQEREYNREQVNRIMEYRANTEGFVPSGYEKDRQRFKKCLKLMEPIGYEDSGDEVNSFKSDNGEPQIYQNNETMGVWKKNATVRMSLGKRKSLSRNNRSIS